MAYRRRRLTNLSSISEYPIQEELTSDNIIDGTVTGNKIKIGSISFKLLDEIIQKEIYDMALKYGLLTLPFNPLPSDGLTLTFTILPDNINGGIVRLDWTAPYLNVAGATFDKYLIYIKATTSSNYNSIPDASINFGVNTCTITGLTNGLSHSVEIKSYNSIYDVSSLGVEATGMIPRRFPYAPTGLTRLSIEDSKVNLLWNLLTGIQRGGSLIISYRIKYTIGTGQTEYFANTENNTPSLLINNLTNGEYYYFNVAGVNFFSELGDYSQQLAYRPIGIPGLPGISNATPGDGLVNITLVAPTYTGGINVTLLGYHVYYKINGTSDIESNWTQSWHSLASVIFPNINVTISGLTNGTKYDFRIKALNEINSGSYVNVLNIRPRGIPSPSTVNSISPSDGAVNISWTAPADRGGVSLNELIYNIIYSTTNTTVPSGTTISPGIITTTSANFTITGLTNGTRYYFWINASNGLYFSNSSVSNSKPRTTPGVVSSLNTSGSNTPTITLSWSSPTNTGGADITGYNIYVNGSFRANISGTGYSITSLPAGSNTFRVHAVNEAGEGTLSNISDYVVNVPGTVSSLSTSGSNTPTITLVWSPPSYSGADITRYDIYVNDIYRTNTSANTIPISSLQSGSNKFGIRAINSVGFQGTIREIFANVVNLPGVVNSLGYTGNNTPTITLFWSIPTNTGGSSITGYNIYVNGSFRANITGTTYSITSLPAGTNTFRVHAVNIAGEGTISSINANVVNVPPMPQDFIASVNAPVTIGNIAFNWGPVTNPTTNTDYMIQSRNVSYNWGYSDFQSIDNSVFTSRSYVVQYPSDYRTLQYSFRIRRTTEGLESYSNESSVTIPNPGFQGIVRIGPNVPSGIYNYYISTPQGVELAEAQIGTSVGEFTINNSPAGLSQLVIRIKRQGTYFGHDPNPHSLGPRISSNVIFDSPLSGYNYINNIDWSTLANNEISFAPRIYSEHLFNSVVSLSFETITLPNAPTNLRNSIESTSSIKISWDLPIGMVSNIILSYRLNIYGTHFFGNHPESWNTSTLEDGWIEVTLSGNTTTHTVYNLEAGRWYTFRTRSAITIGGISYPGKWSSSNIFPHFGNTEFSNWTNAVIPTSAPAPWTSAAWQAAITCSVINDFSNGTLDSQLNLTLGRSGVSTPNFPSVSSNRHWLINFSYPADIVSGFDSLLLDQQKAFRIRRGALFLINDLPSSYEIYVTDRTSSYSLTQLILSMGNLSYNPNNYNRTIRVFDQLAQNNFQTGPVSWVVSAPGNVNLSNVVQFLEIRPKNILGETATNVSSPQRSLLPKVHLPPTIFRVEISYDYLTSATIIKYVFSINQTMLNPASPITKIKMDFIRTASNFVRSINYSIVQYQYDTFTANYSSNTVSVSPGTSNWNVFERTNDWTPFITSSLGTIGESGPWDLNSAPNGNHAGRGGANYKWQSDWGPIRNAQDTYVYNIVTQNTELRGFLVSCMINRTDADVFDPNVAWPQMLMKMFRIRFTVTSTAFPQFSSQGDSYYPTSVIIRPGYILPGFPSTSTTFVR